MSKEKNYFDSKNIFCEKNYFFILSICSKYYGGQNFRDIAHEALLLLLSNEKYDTKNYKKSSIYYAIGDAATKYFGARYIGKKKKVYLKTKNHISFEEIKEKDLNGDINIEDTNNNENKMNQKILITQLIKNLNSKQRKILYLRLAGNSITEISKALDVSVSTINKEFYKIKNRCKEIISTEEDN